MPTPSSTRSCARWPAGSGPPPSRPPRRGGARAGWSSTTCWCSRATCSRHHAEVRDGAAAERYQRLLLDEFQDTDPIQIELAVRIAGGAAAAADRWEDVAIPPGRLFVVGDPKQSIYRFRRADIGTYLRPQEHLGTGVRLSTNFRTVGAVLRLGQRRVRRS